MDKKTFDDRVKRLQDVNEVVKKLDPAIRHDAFALLASYIGRRPASGGQPVEPDSGTGSGVDPSEFLASFDHKKPADNVKLIAAYFYSLYGKEPFTIDELVGTATDAGLTIPERPDATLAASTKGGKKLFKRAGGGAFAPTVHGEKFLKETYEVSKGKQKKPSEATE